MAIKPLKSLIDQYFDERVQVSERGYHCYDSFLRTHENLMQEIKNREGYEEYLKGAVNVNV